MPATLTGQEAHSLKGLRKKVNDLENLVATISRSKVMWETTFDTILDPVMIINARYEIKRANLAMAKACALDIRKVINKKCYEVFAGYTAPCPKCPALMARQSQGALASLLDRFSTNHQYAVNAYAIPDVVGDEPESIVLHYRDVTEEKRLHKKLTHAEKMAAVGTLAGGVAHEINNPLGGILAFVQLALRQIDKGERNDETLRADLKEIERAVLRCKQIVRNLLDFSRHDMSDQLQPLKLEDVIGRSLTLIKINARESDVHVVYDFKADVPPVLGDINQLQQVALNLITNAMHAMKSKGGTLTIATSANKTRSKALLTFTDTGVGIPKDKIDRIFDPYFTTKEQGEGTGLGLSICYNIVQEHGGKIEVSSEEGRGTAMVLEFPALKTSAHEPEANADKRVSHDKTQSASFVTK